MFVKSWDKLTVPIIKFWKKKVIFQWAIGLSHTAPAFTFYRAGKIMPMFRQVSLKANLFTFENGRFQRLELMV
jgi:hypothetical protein